MSIFQAKVTPQTNSSTFKISLSDIFKTISCCLKVFLKIPFLRGSALPAEELHKMCYELHTIPLQHSFAKIRHKSSAGYYLKLKHNFRPLYKHRQQFTEVS